MTATEEKIISDLREEVRKLRAENLKLRVHIDVILSHPGGTACKKIASTYQKKIRNTQAVGI